MYTFACVFNVVQDFFFLCENIFFQYTYYVSSWLITSSESKRKGIYLPVMNTQWSGKQKKVEHAFVPYTKYVSIRLHISIGGPCWNFTRKDTTDFQCILRKIVLLNFKDDTNVRHFHSYAANPRKYPVFLFLFRNQCIGYRTNFFSPYLSELNSPLPKLGNLIFNTQKIASGKLCSKVVYDRDSRRQHIYL